MILKLFACTIFSILFISCSSDIKINSRACVTRARWEVLGPDKYKFKDMFVPYRPDEKLENSHFIKKITLHAPFAFFTPVEFFLRDILEDVGLSCDQVKSVGMTIKEGPMDVLMDFIPPLSQVTLILVGELRGLQTDFEKNLEIEKSHKVEDEDVNVKKEELQNDVDIDEELRDIQEE